LIAHETCDWSEIAARITIHNRRVNSARRGGIGVCPSARCGLLAPSRAPMRPIAEPRSKASSKRILSRPACANSWSGGIDGAERRQTSCGLPIISGVTKFRSVDWPRAPRARGPPAAGTDFAGVLGIEVAFHREGRAGNRIVRMRAASDSAVGTVSEVGPRRSRGRITAP
jgi:hypothetical protein